MKSARFLSLMFLANGIGLAQGQDTAINPRFEPMEREDNPPLAVPFVIESPRMVVTFGAFTSVQVNVNVNNNNIVGDAANEPSICVNPLDRSKMAVGWRQFNTIASNFRQSGYGYSSDGGASWTAPGLLEQNVFRSDPVLDVDRDGRFYYLSLLNNFFDDIWRSVNGGQNWVRLAPATGGDKQWMAIDRTEGPGSGFIYQCWSTAGNNYGGRQFSRSVDGGTTWMEPINMPLQPVWGTFDVDSDGTLYISGTNFGSTFYFLQSSNAQNSAVTPTFDVSKTVNMGGSIQFSIAPVNPGGLGGQCWIAADKSTGLATSNNLYMLCSVRVNGTNPLNVHLIRSTDNGASWSAPIRINDNPPNQTKYHWFGTLSVAPNGRLDAVWNDTRQSANSSLSALYRTYSLDGGQTWAANEQVSAQFNHALGYPNQNKMGDYIQSVSDDEGADVAYCATFNGEQDVYYVRLPAPPITLSGTVTLEDWSGPVSGAQVVFSLRKEGTSVEVASGTTALSAASGYLLELPPGEVFPGSYDLYVKASHWLQKKRTITLPLSGAANQNLTLINGDVDGDNDVDLADYDAFSSAYDSVPSDSNWDPNADLDGDGAVTLLDFDIFSKNFDRDGDA